MRIAAILDSYKGSLTAKQACDAVERGAHAAVKNIVVDKIPLADGGEGTVDAFLSNCGGERRVCRVCGLFGERIDAHYGVINSGRSAIIEVAAASGLMLVDSARRDPLRATTYGTGELIVHALESGIRDVIIGLGGSGTSDGGMGALEALGVRFYDDAGEELGLGGAMLGRVASIDFSHLHPALKESKITLACDVTNPFFGEQGAAYVFAPQKGADPDMVELLDRGLRNFAKVILQTTGKDISNLQSAGAAGGFGGGILAFTDAQVISGFELLRTLSDLDRRIKETDLVITGEGKTDAQTMLGKLPAGVLRIAKELGKPTVCVSGSVEYEERLYQCGFDALFSMINEPMNLEQAMENAEYLLENISRNIVNFFASVQRTV